MTYTKEQLRDIYLTIPEDVKQAMGSIETMDVMENITKNHNLHVDQTGEVSDETGLVMLGVTRPQDFGVNLQKRLPAVAPADIAAIVQEIDTGIFSKIRESLKNIHEGKIEASSTPSTQENTPPTSSTTSTSSGQAAPKPDLFDQKMGQLFNLPREEVTISKSEPVKPALPPDPYRETLA